VRYSYIAVCGFPGYKTILKKGSRKSVWGCLEYKKPNYFIKYKVYITLVCVCNRHLYSLRMLHHVVFCNARWNLWSDPTPR
jgi:hypothetical protein